MSVDESFAKGQEALLAGRWQEARDALEAVLREGEVPQALAYLGDALFWLGETRKAVDCRERAYSAFRRSGDIAAAGESAIWLCIINEAAMGNVPASRGWLARAESLLGNADVGPLRGWLLICRSTYTSDVVRCSEMLEEALATGRTLGDLDLELCALAELGVLLVKLGELEKGLACIDEAMAGALGGDRTTFDTVVFTSCSMLTACDMVADLERATQWTRAADEFNSNYGGPYLYAYCRVVYGRVLLARGNWQEAERELKRAIEATRDTYPAMHRRALVSLADLRLRQGRFDEAEALLDSVEDPIGGAVVAAGLALHRGRPQAAVALLERWLNSADGIVTGPIHAGGGEMTVETAAALCLLVEAQLAAESVAGAEEARRRLAELASSTRSAIAQAHEALASARLSQSIDGDSAAAALFESALERFARLGLPLETARARACLARALAPTRPDLAVSEGRGALHVFERLGASQEADMAAALLRSWGAGGRTGPRDAGLLTRREMEILGLLAAGLSNQEIASRLYISRKTAAHHVSNLLSKLGVRNRAEAAAHAARLESTPPVA